MIKKLYLKWLLRKLPQFTPYRRSMLARANWGALKLLSLAVKAQLNFKMDDGATPPDTIIRVYRDKMNYTFIVPVNGKIMLWNLVHGISVGMEYESISSALASLFYDYIR